MIERHIFTILTEWFAYCQAHPGTIRRLILDDEILDGDEAQKVDDLFVKEAPGVHHSYPRKEVSFPAVFIVLGENGPDEAFLGDDPGIDEDDAAIPSEFVIIEKYAFDLFCYTQNPAHTLYLGWLVRTFLAISDRDLQQAPAYLMKIAVTQSDVQVDSGTLPAQLFMRRIRLSCSRQYNRQRPDSNVGRIKSVRGVHVDRQGSPGSDVGGVRTQVTVSVDDDESED